MATSGTKLCVVCGCDCAGMPRVKDARGRYACRPCAEKRRRARSRAATPTTAAPAAVALAPAEDDVGGLHEILLADLPEQTGPVGELCPGCGLRTKHGSVICMNCGCNLETGRTIETKTKEAKAWAPPRRATSAGIAIGAACAAGGAGLGLAIWVGLSTSTGQAWYSMAAMVGVLSGVGMLIPIRGSGRAASGLVACVPGVVIAAIGLSMFAPEAAEPFEGFAGSERIITMGEDEAVLAGGVWLAIGGLCAYAFGRSNPDESASADDNAGGTEASP